MNTFYAFKNTYFAIIINLLLLHCYKKHSFIIFLVKMFITVFAIIISII